MASSKANWLVPTGLILLAAIPIAAGVVRLVLLAHGGPVTVENARFMGSPLPEILHIIGVTLFTILGALQFSAGVRRKWPRWHRLAGRVVVVSGLVAGLSGLWMAMFYAIVPADDALLHAFRLFFGSAMVVSIILGFLAIRRRDIAWMRRAYAIGQGAGTQALTQLPLLLIFGKPDHLSLALMMGGDWVLNLAIAEWLIRRRPAAPLRAIRAAA